MWPLFRGLVTVFWPLYLMITAVQGRPLRGPLYVSFCNVLHICDFRAHIIRSAVQTTSVVVKCHGNYHTHSHTTALNAHE